MTTQDVGHKEHTKAQDWGTNFRNETEEKLNDLSTSLKNKNWSETTWILVQEKIFPEKLMFRPSKGTADVPTQDIDTRNILGYNVEVPIFEMK